MFYVVEISITDDNKTAKAITEKMSKVEAEMLYHQIMASMMANVNVKEGFCTVLYEDGRQDFELTTSYKRP